VTGDYRFESKKLPMSPLPTTQACSRFYMHFDLWAETGQRLSVSFEDLRGIESRIGWLGEAAIQ
jgi:hypothetical protein